MSNREFDHIFSEGLNQNPPNEYNPQVWENISEKLTQDKRRKKLLGLLPFALFFAMFLGNTWTWNELKKTQKDLAVHEAKSQKTDTIIIYKKEVTTHYDTVYRTVYVRQKNVPEQVTLDNYLNQWLAANNINKTTETSLKLPNENTQNIDYQKAANKKTKLDLTNTQIRDFRLIAFLPSLSTKELWVRKHFFSINREDMKKPKKERNMDVFLKEIKPEKKSINLAVGIPISTEKLNTKSAINIQLENEWNINKHFSISPALAFQKIYIKTLEFRSEWELPTPKFPSSDYSLKYIEGNYKTIQPSLKLKYTFTPNKALMPYVGIGYGVQKRLKSVLEYEFINSLGMEKAIIQEAQFKNWVWNIAQFNTGVEYRFSNQWSAELNLSYQTQLGHKQQIFNTFNSAFALKRNLK